MSLARLRNRLSTTFFRTGKPSSWMFGSAYCKHKQFYNVHHRLLEFEIGDWVWLNLMLRPVQTLVSGAHGKFGLRYAEPFQVLARISWKDRASTTCSMSA